ncbi:MAG: hypothetical protein WBA05_04540 [Gordonia sp. (in: high G+C Gram-positive bacteria)]|uniref:hypothetical protein n=1 Tax=Gordonia TaxID=2053 RepID=UPI003266D013
MVTRRNILFAALGVLVVSLIFGSVYTTGALWADQQTENGGDVETGSILLAPGAGTADTFTFDALAAANMLPGSSTSAALTITNGGSTPLRFRLATAGPGQLAPAGTAVTMNLAGTQGPGCPGTGAAFDAKDTSSPTTAFTTSSAPTGWWPLAKGASTTWCITAKLVSVSPQTAPATFRMIFGFAAEQTR